MFTGGIGGRTFRDSDPTAVAGISILEIEDANPALQVRSSRAVEETVRHLSKRRAGGIGRGYCGDELRGTVRRYAMIATASSCDK